jgi:hypothetical protein
MLAINQCRILCLGVGCPKTKIKIYRTVIWPVVSYGCEAWSVTLSEVNWLRVFENEVLRRIFVMKRDKVTGDWRKLITRNFMIYAPHQHCLAGEIKNSKMVRVCCTYGRKERCIQDFGGETT